MGAAHSFARYSESISAPEAREIIQDAGNHPLVSRIPRLQCSGEQPQQISGSFRRLRPSPGVPGKQDAFQLLAVLAQCLLVSLHFGRVASFVGGLLRSQSTVLIKHDWWILLVDGLLRGQHSVLIKHDDRWLFVVVRHGEASRMRQPWAGFESASAQADARSRSGCAAAGIVAHPAFITKSRCS